MWGGRVYPLFFLFFFVPNLGFSGDIRWFESGEIKPTLKLRVQDNLVITRKSDGKEVIYSSSYGGGSLGLTPTISANVTRIIAVPVSSEKEFGLSVPFEFTTFRLGKQTTSEFGLFNARGEPPPTYPNTFGTIEYISVAVGPYLKWGKDTEIGFALGRSDFQFEGVLTFDPPDNLEQLVLAPSVRNSKVRHFYFEFLYETFFDISIPSRLEYIRLNSEDSGFTISYAQWNYSIFMRF